MVNYGVCGCCLNNLNNLMKTTLTDSDVVGIVANEQHEPAVVVPVVKKRTRRKVVAVESGEVTVTEKNTEAAVIETVNVKSVEIFPETVPVIGEPKTTKHSRNNHRKRHQPRSENTTAQPTSATPEQPRPEKLRPPIEWDRIIKHAQAHNENVEMFWHVKAIYETDKPYLHLVKKELTDLQLEVFEDNRVTEAVMRGAKPPSADEHWRKVYRDEMKTLQKILQGLNVWISDVIPDRKHILHWGEKINQKNSVDKDSQEFFLKRNPKKQQSHPNHHKKSSKGHRFATKS